MFIGIGKVPQPYTLCNILCGSGSTCTEMSSSLEYVLVIDASDIRPRSRYNFYTWSRGETLGLEHSTRVKGLRSKSKV